MDGQILGVFKRREKDDEMMCRFWKLAAENPFQVKCVALNVVRRSVSGPQTCE